MTGPESARISQMTPLLGHLWPAESALLAGSGLDQIGQRLVEARPLRVVGDLCAHAVEFFDQIVAAPSASLWVNSDMDPRPAGRKLLKTSAQGNAFEAPDVSFGPVPAQRLTPFPQCLKEPGTGYCHRTLHPKGT